MLESSFLHADSFGKAICSSRKIMFWGLSKNEEQSFKFKTHPNFWFRKI